MELAKKRKIFNFQKADIYRAILFVVLFVFIILPIIFMVLGLTHDDFSFVFSDSNFGKAVLNSFIYSFAGASIAMVLSLAAAFCLSRVHIRFKSVWVLVLTTPMLIPTLSIGLGIRSLFGTNGFLDKIFGVNVNGIGFLGLIIGSAVSAFPVTFTLIYDAMRYEDKTAYDAAETLGISTFHSFLKVSLPYLKLPLISAFFAGFTWIFSDYGIPMEVAGKVQTLPMYLYQQVLTQYKYGRGAVVGMILLLPAIGAFLFDLFSKDSASGEKAEQKITPSKRFTIISVIVMSIIAILVLMPQFSFIALSFVKSFPNNLSFTWDNMAAAFGNNTGLGVGNYLVNSLLMALFTGIIGTFLAYILAYFVTRFDGWLGKALNFICLVSLAIPGLVFGLGYVFFFSFSKGWFYGTMGILVAVNIVHFLATPYLMAKNALLKLNKNYETVGDTIGVSKARILFNVLVPNSVSTLIDMFSFFFINAMITISAVAFLCTFYNQPLSILINTYDKQGSYEMQAVISFIILIVNIIAKVVLSYLSRVAKKREEPKEGVYMELTRYQFDFLTYLEKVGHVKMSQRQFADSLTVSVGLINKMIKDFTSNGYIQVGSDKIVSLTELGLKAIEPYRVRKAIVIAAGFGSRMAPVTLDTPKPLVKVNGTRIIDTLLDALIAQGITSIYIVRGYKGEQFDALLEKYPSIKFIENPLYNESNNISSVYVAKDVVDRCYICEADLIISDPSVITRYQYSTNYLATPVKETDDWCFGMRGIYINKVMIGGEDVEQMIGISYWNEKDSKKLREDVVNVYNSRGGKENYWDNVPLKICKKDFRVEIRECKRSAVTEIDNYSELVMIDPSYEGYKSK
jgi:iron(III) transport system permease protein